MSVKLLGLPVLVQAVMSFLKEYVIVMAPLAASLDILQGDQSCALEFVKGAHTCATKQKRNPPWCTTGIVLFLFLFQPPHIMKLKQKRGGFNTARDDDVGISQHIATADE
jgi:hypothetical protein